MCLHKQDIIKSMLSVTDLAKLKKTDQQKIV